MELSEQISHCVSDPDFEYGYRKMTFFLRLLGFFVNHKKVYRLMDELNLLHLKQKKAKRNFAVYRTVLPEAPLRILEMDIKMVWVEEHRRHAYILTVIDTFTRVVLGWKAAYQIQKEAVLELWTEIIENHLQTGNCLKAGLQIEIRNDNDGRFSAVRVQEFFRENHLTQVFTHPYTPQENGHIESFHAILSEKLKRHNFWSLKDLEQCLTLFYEKYNNSRIHSSICYLPPSIFWEAYEQGLVETQTDKKKRKMKHKLKVSHQKLSGDMSPRAVPCSFSQALDGIEKKLFGKMSGAAAFIQPSV